MTTHFLPYDVSRCVGTDTPALHRLIDALAEIAAAEYLTAQAAPQAAHDPPRTERVALPDLDSAA